MSWKTIQIPADRFDEWMNRHVYQYEEKPTDGQIVAQTADGVPLIKILNSSGGTITACIYQTREQEEVQDR